MKTQYKQMHRRSSTRSQFFRALHVEGLENRRLLAADFGAAVDASIASIAELGGESIAAEISTAVEQNADGGATTGIGSALLDILASIRSRLRADMEPTSDGGELRLASLTVELPSGEEYGLSLFKSGTFDFRLVISSTPVDAAAAGDLGTSVNSTLNAGGTDISDALPAEASLMPDVNLVSPFDAGVLDTTSVSTDESAGLGSSASLGGWSSFFPEPSTDVMAGMTAGAGGSISSGSSSDIAAPMFMGNMNAGSLNAGSLNSMFDASGGTDFTASPSFGTMWPTGISSGSR